MIGRKLVALTGLAAVAGLAAMVAVAPAGAAKKPTVAIFYYNASPFGIANKNASVAAAKKAGFNTVTFNANNDPKVQLNQMRDAITTGKYQAFWVETLDAVSLAPQVARAAQKGIKVGQADNTFGGLNDQIKLSAKPNLTVTVGQSEQGQMDALVTMIKGACAKAVGAGKNCKVAFMAGLDNFPTDVLRINYMKKKLASGPISIDFTPVGFYDQTKAQQAALTYFGAHKDANVVGTFGDQMTAGVLTAFKQVGITPGKDVQVFTVGGTREMIGGIKSGTIYAVGTLWPRTQAEIAMPLLAKAVKGQKVPKLINVISAKHPTIITKAFLQKNPKFVSDWNLAGN